MNEQDRKTRTIVIVATLDTRGDEVEFLRQLIESKGHSVMTVDVGVMGNPHMPADFTRQKVAEAGGKSLQQLVEEANAGADRKQATDVMIAGARKIVADLSSAGRLDGILSLGGSTAAATGAVVMKGLPIGLPKLLITTFISLTPVGDDDITVMQSPVDLVGLNRIVARTLANAAGAIVGMVEQEVPKSLERKLVGMTALGVTTPAVQKAISGLEKRGYDSIVFHATTEKLDRMVRDGVIDAILDLTTFETIPKVLYSAELLSALSKSAQLDRSRLSCAIERAIPQVIAPGGLDMHIFPGATGIDSVPSEYRNRAWSMHGPNVVLVRTTEQELVEVGTDIAERANRAAGPVAIVIPLRGFSEASKKNAPLYDPQADQGFIQALKRNLDKRVKVIEVDCSINDDGFVDEVLRTFDELITSVEGR
ncbi:MAG: Tm-1-like ATP-binding domain-containing protein [Dehalococcoidia bacterium]|nr:MAG: Tm-1-like ATP-binding domain-containing protein [Dehalococcoidia bacterium]